MGSRRSGGTHIGVDPSLELVGGNADRRTRTAEPDDRKPSLIRPSVDAGPRDVQPLGGLGDSQEITRTCRRHTNTIAEVLTASLASRQMCADGAVEVVARRAPGLRDVVGQEGTAA